MTPYRADQSMDTREVDIYEKELKLEVECGERLSEGVLMIGAGIFMAALDFFLLMSNP